MDDYISFDAVVEPVDWGKSTYTIVRLPEEVVNRLGPAKRVEGEFNEHPINLALTRAPVVDGVFLWAGKSLTRKAKLEPGKLFEARLRPVDPDLVDVPADVLNALRASGAMEVWEALNPGKKRGLLYPIESAKREQTRADRITKMLTTLR